MAFGKFVADSLFEAICACPPEWRIYRESSFEAIGACAPGAKRASRFLLMGQRASSGIKNSMPVVLCGVIVAFVYENYSKTAAAVQCRMRFSEKDDAEVELDEPSGEDDAGQRRSCSTGNDGADALRRIQKRARERGFSGRNRG